MQKSRTLNVVCFLCAGVLLGALTSGAQPVTRIATGQNHSLFLKSDGSLWAMGNNDYGQLGDGTFNQTNSPERILTNNVKAIAAGAFHSLVLKQDGSLWGMGLDYFGELGCGSGTFNWPHYGTNQPEQIAASNVVAIAGGGAHSLFLKNDGSMWGMGYNEYGQLGDGSTNNALYAEQIVTSNVTAIAGGGFHSLFATGDGSLWAMGWNQYGQLGDGTTNDVNTPEEIVTNHVVAVAAGVVHSLFLKDDGSLWAMGLNWSGELGDGTTNESNFPELIVTSNVVAIAAGNGFSLFIKNDGSLWAMGDNQYGQFASGTTNNFLFNTNRPQQISAGGVLAVSAGYTNSLVLQSDGSLWASGNNACGQLGDGTTNSSNQAVEVVAIPPGYNQVSGKLLSAGKMMLSFTGIARTSYALDRSPSLSPPDWVPVTTNAADDTGALVFTNSPVPGSQNFWRVRSVP